MEENSKKYIYGIIRKPKGFQEKMTGVEGKKVDLVDFKNISAVVSSVETDDEQDLIKRDNIFAHERIVEDLMRRFDVILPVSFGTLAENDQILLKNILQNNYGLLDKTIRRLEGKVEVNLKAIWKNLRPVVQQIVKENPQLRAQKSNERLSFQEIVEIGSIVSQEVEQKKDLLKQRCLAELKKDYFTFKELSVAEDEMIFNLALLVDKRKRDKLREKFIQLDQKIADSNIVFQYSEPMAPYNFVDLLIQL